MDLPSICRYPSVRRKEARSMKPNTICKKWRNCRFSCQTSVVTNILLRPTPGNQIHQ